MNGPQASLASLRDTAAKHCLCLSYHVTLPGSTAGADQTDFISCFVVEIEDDWWLVTAGHVINGIKLLISQQGNAFQFQPP